MLWKSYPFDSLGNYQFSVIFARYRGKWVFVRHEERETWEMPGGHIEKGETPGRAAERELYEESGAREFVLHPVADYWASAKGDDAARIKGESAGQIYLADITLLGDLPESEIAEVRLFDDIPENLTYPDIIGPNFVLVAEKCAELGI